MKGHSGIQKSKLRIVILLGATVLTNPGWQMFSKLQSKKKQKQGVCGVCNGCPNGWHGRGNVWPVIPSAWGAATLGCSVATLEAQEEGVVSIWAPISRISNVHSGPTHRWTLSSGF